VEDRYERERFFHNKAFDQGTRNRVQKFYTVAENSFAFYKDRLTSAAGGRDVLEYGCGQGSFAFLLAKLRDRVVGIDISDVAIDQARERARHEGATIDFRVMNAERLQLPCASFDLICGVAILHHLDLEAAFSEIRRILRPDGTAVFLETMGHNPLINLYRRLTPQLRTPDEHPLLMPDLERARQSFRQVDLHFFNLSSLAAVPLWRLAMFDRTCRALHGLDSVLFTGLPFMRKYAWQVVMVLAQPIS
jgi:SAM-dependent methyltransferase